jgi:hypothetical protein
VLLGVRPLAALGGGPFLHEFDWRHVCYPRLNGGRA